MKIMNEHDPPFVRHIKFVGMLLFSNTDSACNLVKYVGRLTCVMWPAVKRPSMLGNASISSKEPSLPLTKKIAAHETEIGNALEVNRLYHLWIKGSYIITFPTLVASLWKGQNTKVAYTSQWQNHKGHLTALEVQNETNTKFRTGNQLPQTF